MKANHNTALTKLITDCAVLAVSKALNLKANHNHSGAGAKRPRAVLAVPRIQNLGSGGKSL